MEQVRQATISEWSEAEWPAMHTLVMKESGFNPHAKNPRSTAFGLFQFLDSTWKSVGIQKTSDVSQQIQAGILYIQRRYGTPSRALAYHRQNNWY